jgi:hypothetical protein
MTNNDAPNFASILDETPDHVEAPKARPVGPYVFVVGAPAMGKSRKKGTPYIEFPLRALAAEDGVDPDALEEAGGVEGFKTRITFYLTEDSVYRLDQFHEHCGIDLKSDNTSRKTRNDSVVNATVIGIVEHEYPLDATTGEPDLTKEPYVRINRTAPAV